MRWCEIAYPCENRNNNEAVCKPEVTKKKPDFETDDITSIVSYGLLDVEYSIGYVQNQCVLIDDDGYAWKVPDGFVYEQPYQGMAWKATQM